MLAQAGTTEAASVVVAIAGWKGSDIGLWPALAGLTSIGCRVLVLNLPGAGVSPSPAVRLTRMDMLLDIVERAIYGLDLGEQVVLLGHSFGGTVASALLARAPLAAGLVLVSPVVTAPISKPGSRSAVPRAIGCVERVALSQLPRSISNALMRSAAIDAGTNAALTARGLRGLRAILDASRDERRLMVDPRAMGDQLQLALEHGCLEVAPAISSPAWIIAGDKDRVSSPEELHALCTAFPDARMSLIQGAGHLAHHEDTVEVASLVAGAVEDILTRETMRS